VREENEKKGASNRVRDIGVRASRNAIAPVKQVSSMPVAGEKQCNVDNVLQQF